MINVQETTKSEGTLLVKTGDEDTSLSHVEHINDLSPREVAEYSADLLAQIRDMSGRSGLTFLSYLVQVALEEAKIQAGKKSGQ